MEVHHLKTINPYYSQVELGLKNFELRKNDRDFKVGDLLVLQEYEPEFGYTGHEIVKLVSMVLEDCPHYGLMQGFCILGLLPYKPKINADQPSAHSLWKKANEQGLDLKDLLKENGVIVCAKCFGTGWIHIGGSFGGSVETIKCECQSQTK